ncbi:multiubiquitin domain-containing protein [Paraburkholderia fungorum]|uniref:multiubiquitin domain-containing protein n=1 Tax=Paraburkholderia fungorum TaxID=134537 RepID=UPI0038B8E896
MNTSNDTAGGHLPHKIALAHDSLKFREFFVDEAAPSGKAILRAAGLNADGDVSLFAIRETGDFEDVRLDEHVQLHGDSEQRFVAFHSDREFRFMVNARQVVWGHPRLDGELLYALALSEPGDAIFQIVKGESDRLVERHEEIDLSLPGVEHFEKRPRPSHEFLIVVNGREETVKERRVTFEQLVALAYAGEPPMPNITYSITYRKVASVPHSGELAAGGHVEVQNGSIFNVGRTIQS